MENCDGWKKLTGSLLAFVCMASSAMALVVPDADFEDIPLASGGWSYIENSNADPVATAGSPWYATDPDTAWIMNNYAAGPPDYPSAAHSGDQWMSLYGSYVSQSLTDTFVAGNIYELSVSATVYEGDGSGKDLWLYILDNNGSAHGWTGALELANSGAIPIDDSDVNTWNQYSFQYEAQPADDGKTIAIAMWGTWGQVDDVAVTVVPEPATFALLGSVVLSLGGLGMIRRRKRC